MARYIDADALEYTRVQIFHGLNEDGTPCVGGWNAVAMSCAIKGAPTINPADLVPQGRWIDGADSFGAKRGEFRVCSFCNVCIPTCDNIVPPHMWVWCPKCGADMRERADEDIGPYKEAGRRERKRKCGECPHGKRCYFPRGDYVVLCKKLSTEDDPVYRTPMDGCPARMKEDDPDAEA